MNDVSMTYQARKELAGIDKSGWQKCLAILQVTCGYILAENEADSTEIAEYRRRLSDYINVCQVAGVKAGNLGAYAAMGLTGQIIGTWAAGRSGTEKKEFALQVKRLFSAFRESLAQEGYISPPVAIFWAKNFDGLSDNPADTAERENPLGEGMSSLEIAEKYKDIIIDDE